MSLIALIHTEHTIKTISTNSYTINNYLVCRGKVADSTLCNHFYCGNLNILTGISFFYSNRKNFTTVFIRSFFAVCPFFYVKQLLLFQQFHTHLNGFVVKSGQQFSLTFHVDDYLKTYLHENLLLQLFFCQYENSAVL